MAIDKAGENMKRFVLKYTGLLMALWLFAPQTASAYINYQSDSDFLANANFVKYFGGNLRWGNNATNGDWEVAVVDGNDYPLGTPEQYTWEGLHSYSFVVTPDQPGQFNTSLTVDTNANQVVHTAQAQTLGSINALAIRANADSDNGDVATLYDPITINLSSGGQITLPTLVGDSGDGTYGSGAEYFVVIDDRLNDGFEVKGSALLQDGARSYPMYSFKVGRVPIPGAAWLLATAVVVPVGVRRFFRKG